MNRNIFVPSLLGFPLKLTAGMKAAGTDDGDSSGPFFPPLLSTEERKIWAVVHFLCIHLTLSRLLFLIQLPRRGVMIQYTEKQVKLCLCTQVSLCILLWQKWRWKVLTGPSGDNWLSPPNLFSGIPCSFNSLWINRTERRMLDQSWCLFSEVCSDVCVCDSTR